MTARALAHETGDYEQEVAAKLRGYLAEKRITRHELADRLGQTEFWIGRRVGGRTPITVGELARIAEVLHEPITRFLPGGRAQSFDYGSEGWGFESLRVHPPQRRRTDRRHLSVVPIYAVA